MSRTNPLVAQQYTEWTYPEPITDIAAWKAEGNHQICDPSLHHALLWPERPYSPDLCILVAGCGTSQAAILAHGNPAATVIGIDLSATSLEYSAALKEKHKLSNLELRQMDLHDAALIGQKFDLIYSTGVLHHLPNPQAGLERLRDVLADHGVMCLMLYGKYLRTGVYWIQEALRRMGIAQTKADIAFTRALIGSLPPWHAAQAYIQSAACDLVYDGGLVDTFLHRQDRAYSVPDILALVAACDLSFHGWIDNLVYYPDGVMPADHPAYSKIASLPDEEQWPIVELLMQSLGRHEFLMRKKTGDGEKSRVNFNSPSFLKTIPARRFGIIAKDEGGVINLRRSWHSLQLSGLERDLYLSVDGMTPLEKMIGLHVKDSSEKEKQARQFFKRMGRLGHFTFSRCAK
jgi:SAM-dependent methyltransferase